ncbi:sperm-associated antigen 4 protein-like [Strigops habroptila]|uniref:sperm-associated antigen 4 protein-like n=1 Tax=Strigops habroptila TaxID=2489341 RepID=UPI0011CFBF63|nr:sperm-associated antigen 4 protein-like [Strigops habroptila]
MRRGAGPGPGAAAAAERGEVTRQRAGRAWRGAPLLRSTRRPAAKSQHAAAAVLQTPSIRAGLQRCLQSGNGRDLPSETPQHRNLDAERDEGPEKREALHDLLLDEPHCSRWCLVRDLAAHVGAVWKECATGLEALGIAGHCRNTPDLWKGQAGEMQQLRGDVARLAAEIGAIKKEVQQMREAMSDPMEVSDWALKSAGTAIDLQRSSSTSAWFRRVFCFLCAPPVEDTFVQPDASPGSCWPLQQSRSEVLIRLPTEVQPTAITLQHSSKIATPLGTVRSAPQNFTVSGLDEEGQDETLLGSFIYSVQKEPTQSFPLQNGIPRAFRVLKLGIQSNWGNPRHTCIYRVQVHGKMVGTNAINKTDVETPLNKN